MRIAFFLVSDALLHLGSARYKLEPRTNFEPRIGGVFFALIFLNFILDLDLRQLAAVAGRIPRQKIM